MKPCRQPASFRGRAFLSLVAAVPLMASPRPAAADASCRSVEVRFAPQGLPATPTREALSPQIAVWVTDGSGKFIADVFVTRTVGLLGLGNRPGNALLKSDFRWPYGRRPMALPIWAYGRGKTYGFIAMGGRCSPACPPDFTSDPSDDDNTVAYHGPVSSDEPFFCSPSGKRIQRENDVDVVSCASSFFGSKGWYVPGRISAYPPRADLRAMGGNDHPDVLRFARDNDVAVVSGATPPTGRVLDNPIRWLPPDNLQGDFSLNVEVNTEADFNASWPPGKNMDEPHKEWNHLGHHFIGQPSILYKVPFRLDGTCRVTTATEYAGYGDWKGESGMVHPPDSSISSNASGSGADRLKLVSDENGAWRVKVTLGSCDVGRCATPAAPQAMDLSETTDATLTVRFQIPPGEPITQLQVKYQPGAPITPETFDRAMPVPSPNLGVPGAVVKTQIVGLQPQTKYYVAARALNCCGTPSPLLTGEAITQNGQFVTLSGCFIATAAHGSDMAPAVTTLRRFRDRHLLSHPIGQIAVASYYAISPALANVIRANAPLRALSRSALAPLAEFAGRLPPLH
jgi:hypothetical protein